MKLFQNSSSRQVSLGAALAMTATPVMAAI